MDFREINDRHRARAGKVVESFKAQLDESVLRQIPATEFDELEQMIEEAISDELHGAAEMVEGVARRLRAESNLPEIGM